MKSIEERMKEIRHTLMGILPLAVIVEVQHKDPETAEKMRNAVSEVYRLMNCED